MSTRRMSQEKERAHYLVRYAVMTGKIVKPENCGKCGQNPGVARDGRSKLQGHHHRGYEFPLDVEWLCSKCHWDETEHPNLLQNMRDARAVGMQIRKRA